MPTWVRNSLKGQGEKVRNEDPVLEGHSPDSQRLEQLWDGFPIWLRDHSRSSRRVLEWGEVGDSRSWNIVLVVGGHVLGGYRRLDCAL